MINKTRVKFGLVKLINLLFPKKKNLYFFEPLDNCQIDKYDIINYSGDSMLTYVNYLINNSRRLGGNMIINMIIYHPDRINKYKNYFSQDDFLKINYVISYKCYRGIKKIYQKIYIYYLKFISCAWYFEGIPSDNAYACMNQRQVSVGYFASCKSDFGLSNYDSIADEWQLIAATSKLDATIKSAAYHVRYEDIYSIGLPRNDNLFAEITTFTKENIYSCHEIPLDSKIILFAPTYRDYEANEEIERGLWGFSSSQELYNFLENNNYYVIAKLHPRQNSSIINNSSKNVKMYKASFNYSLYDIMKLASVLITDYSSICFDWMLLDKPIIYNLYDKEKYERLRGTAFEPYEYMCAGEVISSEQELVKAIDNAFNDTIIREKNDKYQFVKKTMFKYCDSKTCERMFRILNKQENGI